MSVLAAMAIAVGLAGLLAAANEHERASRIKAELDIDVLLFVIGDAMGQERPAVLDALVAGRHADPLARAQRHAYAVQADDAIRTVGKVLAQQSDPVAGRQLDLVRSVSERLPAWRGMADRMLGPAGRDSFSEDLPRYLAELDSMHEALEAALAAHNDSGKLGGIPADLLTLARQAISARRLSAQRLGPVLAAASAGWRLSSQSMRNQASIDGALKTLWPQIEALAERLDAAAGTRAPMESARAIFAASDQDLRAAVAALGAGLPLSDPVPDLYQAEFKSARGLERLRDTAIDAAQAQLATAELLAVIGMAGSVAGGILAAALCAWVLHALRTRVLGPLAALSEVIGRLTRHDYDVIVPSLRPTDEIGQMGAAIETLRRAGMNAAASETRISHAARHDGLTGLANRATLFERLDQAMALVGRGHQCALLYIDLDRFAAVNDALGHAVGDLVLQAAATRLADCARETDTVFRLGSDDFVMLLTNIAETGNAGPVANRVLRVLQQPFQVDGQDVAIGCSIGIAVAPQDGLSPDALLQSAAIALERAKTDQPGTLCFFEAEMDHRQAARTTLERDLREAIQTDRLELIYQPQFTVGSGKLTGFEAMVCWTHPVRGFVGPGEFIPLAEETGLIVPIGAWVLRQACWEAMNWPDWVRLAVNLSPVEFKGNALLPAVQQALQASGLRPARLELEVSEAVLAKDRDANLSVLHALHAAGAVIALDGFGAGQSSLSQLLCFPFDKIKIDRSCIASLSERGEAGAAARAAIALGNSLGVATTAVGVETEYQLAQLRALGCTEAQGNLFSRPTVPDTARRMAAGEMAAKNFAA
jgi:diguanylate cyclase (GGDEF)-like protein